MVDAIICMLCADGACRREGRGEQTASREGQATEGKGDGWAGAGKGWGQETLFPVAPSSSRNTMDSAKVASFTYGSACQHETATQCSLAL